MTLQLAPPSAVARADQRYRQWRELHPDDHAAHRLLGFLEAEIAVMVDDPCTAALRAGSLAGRR